MRLSKYLIIAAVLQIVWGFVPSASKVVIGEIPVELYIALRWSLSGLIFVGYLSATRAWRPVSRRDLGWVCLLGVLGHGLASLGTLYGLKVGGVTNFALMSSLSPVVTSAVSIWILRERPSRLFYFALPLSFFGLLLLVMGKYRASSIQVAGLSAACIVGGYVLEAFVFVFSKKFKTKISSTQYLAVAQLSAAAWMWALQFFFFHQSAELLNLSLKGALAALFVSVVACVLCYSVLYWLLKHLDGHRLALFDSFHALSATCVGYLLFRETLTPLMLLGGVLILAGLVIGNMPQSNTIDATADVL